MRILKEDKNQLVFTIYPTIYFLFFNIFLFLVMAYALVHPEIFNLVYPWPHLQYYSQSILAGKITTIALIIIFFANLIASYTMPIRVLLDKASNTITYRYFNGMQRVPGQEVFLITKIVPIDSLRQLVYTSKMPELSGIQYKNTTLAKYRFGLTDNSFIDVYAGFFSMSTHRNAFIKISEYLKIPYVNDQGNAIELENVSDHTFKYAHLIKILLIILLVLILLLILFLGTVFLIIYFR